MANCVNMNSKEFKDLVEKSGLNPLVLSCEISVLSKYIGDRFPTIEELNHYHDSKKVAALSTEDFSELLEESGNESLLDKRRYQERQLEHALASPVKKPDQKSLLNYSEYRKYKENLLERLEQHFEDYKKLNTKFKGTQDYLDKVSSMTLAINTLKEEIGLLKSSSEADLLFGEIYKELEFLDRELDTKDPFHIQHFETFYRLETLSRFILGMDLRGHTIQDGEFRLDRTAVEGFEKFASKMADLKNKYDRLVIQVANQAIKENPLFVMAAKELGQEDLDAFFEGFATDISKDINFFQETFLGINSNDDTAYAEGINLIYESNIRKVQQNISKDTQRIEELWHVLKNRKFNFSDFVMRDEYGNLTDQLVSKYSDSWNRRLSQLFKLRKEASTKDPSSKKLAYSYFIKELAKDADIIDIRKLKVFQEEFGEEFGEFFKFSDEEMAEYEENLRGLFGRTYDAEIEAQRDSIKQYLNYIQSLELSDDKKIEFQKLQNNPFLFVEDFYDPNMRGKSRIVKTKNYDVPIVNLGFYNKYVPKKTYSNGQDTGFYDPNFSSTVEVSEEVFEMWSLLKKVITEHINPAYTLGGKYMKAMTLPMLKMDFYETVSKSWKHGGIKAMVKKPLNSVINSWQDLWFEKTFETDGETRLVSNYSNRAQKEIREMNKALGLLPTKELLEIGKGLGLSFKEDTPKEDITIAIARAKVMPTYSTDVVKNVLAVAELATLQRARRESAFLIETLYESHVNMPSVTDSKKIRGRSNMKLRNWIDVNIYGSRNKASEDNVLTKANIKKYSESEKELIKVLKRAIISGEDMRFKVGGLTYQLENGKYSYEESIKNGGTGKVTEITKEEFETAFGAYIKEQKAAMGAIMTFSSVIQGAMSVLSMKYLGFNPKSGVKNRVDGWFMNLIRDAEGIFWKNGNLKYSTRILADANVLRLAPEKLTSARKKKKAQLVTLDLLMNSMGVLQDRRDFRDKKNNVSTFSRHKELYKLYNFSVGMPEYKNQLEIALSIMQDVKLKDAFGNEHSLCNGTGIVLGKDGKIIDRGCYFPAYKPGTLELRDEFKYTAEAFDSNGKLRTDINLEDFINKENIGFETFELNLVEKDQNLVHQVTKKISHTISSTQGNFNSLDSILAMDHILGRAAMMFKRYLPEHINQRFGKRGANMATGQRAYEGRYRILMRNSGALATASSIAALSLFGPQMSILALFGTIIAPAFFSKIATKWFGKTQVKGLLDNILVSLGMIEEVLLNTTNLPLRLTPVNLTDIKYKNKTGERVSLGSENYFFNKLENKKALTEDEVGALKAMCQELSIAISLPLMIMALSNLFGGGEDDDEIKKGRRNYIDNLGNELLKNLTQYYSPKVLFDETTNMTLLGTIEDGFKFVKYFNEYLVGERDFGEVVGKANKFNFIVPIPNYLVKKTKKIANNEDLFGEDREYNTGQWFDKYKMPQETKDAKTLKNSRSTLKELYISEIQERLREEYEGFDEAQIEEYSKKIASGLMRRDVVEKQTASGETTKQALERIDFNAAMDEAEELISEYDLDAAILEIEKKAQEKERKKEEWARVLAEKEGKEDDEE